VTGVQPSVGGAPWSDSGPCTLNLGPQSHSSSSNSCLPLCLLSSTAQTGLAYISPHSALSRAKNVRLGRFSFTVWFYFFAPRMVFLFFGFSFLFFRFHFFLLLFIPCLFIYFTNACIFLKYKEYFYQYFFSFSIFSWSLHFNILIRKLYLRDINFDMYELFS
jgi:hypothetical protein